MKLSRLVTMPLFALGLVALLPANAGAL